MNKKIDIIIPAYNVKDDILFRCLSSIACQNNKQDLEITIIDDASTEQNYQQIINIFKDYLKINLLTYEKNGGPGVARQYGLDHTNNEYITFIDADDTFNGSFALSSLVEGIEQHPSYQICIGCFDEIHSNIQNQSGTIVLPHENDIVWVFGKLYKRSFLEKYKIRFHSTSRANEDNGFNKLCQLCMTPEEQINFIPAHVYYWHENEHSITRANNCEYSFGGSCKDSFYGFVENMIYAIKEAKKRNPYNPLITIHAVNVMFNLYEYYIECLNRAPEHAPNNLKWCKKYYKEIYSKLEEDISDNIFKQHYNEVMRAAYIANKFENIIPQINIYEFLESLKEKDEEN